MKKKNKNITITIQQDAAKTEKKLMAGFFECLQTLELRSPYCTGKGYGVGKKENICSPCLTELKKSVSFSAG